MIEILSPDDRMADVLEKLAEYRTLGVPHVWLADPIARRFFVYTGGLLEAPAFGLPEFGLEITPGEIFD